MHVPLTLIQPDGRARTIAVRWQRRATVGQLIEAAGAASAVSVWVSRTGRALGPGNALGDAEIRPGDILVLESARRGAVPARPGQAQHDLARAAHLAVTGGPDAGLMFALAPGEHVLGREPGCAFTLSEGDKEISRRHLAVTVSPDSVTIEDLGSSNGTYVDGERISGPTPLLPGQLLEIGASRLQIVSGSAPDVQLSPGPDGCLVVRRPPRLHLPSAAVEIEWPEEPRKPDKHSIPLVAMLAPVVVGVALWALTRNLTTLLFVGLSPAMIVGNVLSERASSGRRHKRDLAAFRLNLAAAQRQLDEESTTEGARRRDSFPDPAAVLATAAGPRRRLWERRRDAPDFLVIRLGLAELDSDIRVKRPAGAADPVAQPPLRVANVPCTIPLATAGVVGLAGATENTRMMARWMVGQNAVASGPSDLRMVLLTDSGAERDWGHMLWLPHVAPDRGWPAPGLGTCAETVQKRIRELVEVIQQRQHLAETWRSAGRPDWPWVLVVLDGAYALRALPGMDAVLRDGPPVGVVAICLEEAQQRLPVECRTVVDADGHWATLRASGQAPVERILLDGASQAWSEAVARCLAPLRDPEGRAGGVIPESVRLADLLGTDATSAEAVAAVWQQSPRSTSAPIGAGSDGTVLVDLRADGPHGLVAGTTGAGKSEFLQTMVCSLAVANRPDALTFLLIDYKGGAAFRDCARLPHTVGVVTDLDGHLTERALQSLSAELRRREELLGRAGAKDIEDYVAAGEPAGRLPRLVIAVDEFADMVAELPEFVTRLVGIARQGRSLGVHLILSTQRPSGVVSPEIRANSNLRISFRVTSAAESTDIIDAADAATIQPHTPGRGYLRTGHSSLLAFQSARVTGTDPRAADGYTPVAVADIPWDRAGWAAELDQRAAGNVPPDPAGSDLARITKALTEAADMLAVGRVPRPWLEPLPDLLPLAELSRAAPAAGRTGVHAAPFGLVDLPAEQAQRPVCFDLETGRHLLVVGSPGSGRTTFLRTLSAALAAGNSPADLWLYAIDCGGGELRALAGLPHTGTVVTRLETDRTVRLVARLRAEVTRRLDALASGGFSDITEQRAVAAPADRLPYLLVLLDRWEGFTSAFGDLDAGRLVDEVTELAREGGAAGLRLVLTGDRNLLTGKLSAVVDERICLDLADRTDFTLAGLNLRDVPARLPPGRAVRPADAAELQIALVGTDPSGPGQAAGLAAVVASARTRATGAGCRPFRIDPLPDRVDLTAASRLPGWRPAPQWVVAGVGGDELAAIGVDLKLHEPGFTIAGPRRSGRSTALVAIAESMLAGGNLVLALCPRPSPLRALAGSRGVVAVLDGLQPPAERLVELLNDTPGPLGVLVDDASALHGTVVGDLLDQQASEAADKGHTMVIAGIADELLRPMRGFIAEVRQSRTGLLLCPESHLHGEVVGMRLPRSAAFSGPPGRGILVVDNQAALVQVPQVPCGPTRS